MLANLIKLDQTSPKHSLVVTLTSAFRQKPANLHAFLISFIKLYQNRSNLFILDQIGSNWLDLDQIGSLDLSFELELKPKFLTNMFLTTMV